MSERTLAEILEEHGLTPELLSGPRMSRREFLTLMGGGIVVLLTAPALGFGADAPIGRRTPLPVTRETPHEITGWLYIDQQGAVTAYAGKVELGQNVRTMLSQVVGEELRLPANAVHMVLGDTDLTPFDVGTFGSRTTPTVVPPLRQAAAAARELLLTLAAEQLRADRGKLTLQDGKLTDPATHRSLGFGELTKGQELLQVIPQDVKAIAPTQWQVAGKPLRKVDAMDIVTGSKRYASDFKRLGMLYAKVVHGEALKDTLKSADTSRAEAMPGVLVYREGGYLAVAAPTEAAAEQAFATIKAEWDHKPQLAAKDLHKHLRETAGGPSNGGVTTGSIADGMAQADVKLKQTYIVSYVAHAAIEPRSAIAEWGQDGRLTVWCSTQSPFGVRSGLAQTLGLPESRIHVLGLDTGVGYGGKTPCQPAADAARLAKQLQKPVRVAWTREKEMSCNYYRPAGIIDISSGMKPDGTLVAWDYHNYNSGPAALRTPYDVPNQIVQFHPCDAPLPQGAYRGLAAPVNTFARETHMDELAVALKLDPVQFRLHNASDARLRTVIKEAAQHFDWRAKPAAGAGFGVAAGTDKGSYAATCAEAYVDARGQVTVRRILTAFECGAIINPLQLRNQVEGGAAMALGAALFEAIEFDDGHILNPTFSQYRVPRFSDLPKIESVLIDRKDLTSVGAGETPTCAIAAAIGNAICNATGVRLRSLPLVPSGMPK